MKKPVKKAAAKKSAAKKAPKVKPQSQGESTAPVTKQHIDAAAGEYLHAIREKVIEARRLELSSLRHANVDLARLYFLPPAASIERGILPGKIVGRQNGVDQIFLVRQLLDPGAATADAALSVSIKLYRLSDILDSTFYEQTDAALWLANAAGHYKSNVPVSNPVEPTADPEEEIV